MKIIAIIRNILVRVGADITSYQRNMATAQRTTTGWQTAMRTATASTHSSMQSMVASLTMGRLGLIALGAAAIATFGIVGKKAISSAMDVVESESLFAVSMGSMGAAARAWSEQLQASLGLNAYEVRRNVGVFYNMTTSMGLTRNAAYKLSTDLTKLAYDMSSFYNMPVEEMFTKLQSGITGETEPLKRIGILVLDSTIKQYAYAEGIANVGAELTEQQKVMARYLAIMGQTKNANGDLARTITSPSNQLRLLRMQLQLASINLGNAFMPIVTIVMPILTNFAKGLVRVTNTFAQFMSALFGTNSAQAQNAQSAADAAAAEGKLGDAAKKAGDKAKKSVAGFDQLNLLQENLAAGAGGAADALDGGSTMPTPAKDGSGGGVIPQGVLDAANKTRAVLGNLKQKANEVSESLLTVFGPLIQQSVLVFRNVVNGVKESLSMMYKTVSASLKPIIDWFVTNGLPLLASFGSGAATIFQSIFNTAKAIFDTLWQGVVDPAMKLISKIVLDALNMIKGFWDKYGADIVGGIVGVFESIKTLFTQLWNSFLGPIVKNMLTELSWFWDKHLKGVFEEVMSFIGKLVTGALQIWNEFISPVINYLVRDLGPAFSLAFSLAADVFGTFIAVIADSVKAIFRILGGVIDFIVGVFTGDWAKAWQGVKDIFGGIFDGIAAIVKGVINTIIDLVNLMIRGLDKISFDIPGKGKFGVDIPEIPKLANGGAAYSPSLAVIGDNKQAFNDPEIVSPLSKMQEGIYQAVSNAMASNRGNNSGDTTVILKLGESELGRAVIKAVNSVQRQTGKTLLSI